MILLDTSIWIEHFSRPIPTLVRLLSDAEFAVHTFVIGGIALGTLRARGALASLAKLQPVRIAFDSEVLMSIERYRLGGSAIGHVDAHLLAATRLTDDVRLWTRDRRLQAMAERLGVGHRPAA